MVGADSGRLSLVSHSAVMSGRPLHALTHCLSRSMAALQAVAEGQSADLPELLTHEAGAAKRTRYGSF